MERNSSSSKPLGQVPCLFRVYGLSQQERLIILPEAAPDDQTEWKARSERIIISSLYMPELL
jgi:hypothetical protein